MAEIKFRPKDRNSFRVGDEVGQLWEGEVPITVRPKQWQLLRYLAERPGKPIMKPTLLDDIWGRDVAVQPQIVDQTLAGLRQRLGDKAKGSRFIETVSGGLKFVADIETSNEQGAVDPEWINAENGTESPEQISPLPVVDKIRIKLDWRVFGAAWLHVDQPLFEKYSSNEFSRGGARAQTAECPQFFRLLLSCPGVAEISKWSPYKLRIGTSEFA